MRLDKCIEKAALASRKQTKRLFKLGKIVVDGRPAHCLNQIVDPSFQEIVVDGQKIENQGCLYFLLHKPAGYVTAVSDLRYQTVLDLLRHEDRQTGLYPVGRLDRDTEGLLLITNNGPLGFRLLHPKHHVEKVYEVVVNGFLDTDAPSFFESGVAFLDGTTCKPAHLEVLERGLAESRARIRIQEGKFHQVKKMFLAYGVKVIYLKRIAFAGFELGNLPRGQYRRLKKAELEELKAYFDI